MQNPTRRYIQDILSGNDGWIFEQQGCASITTINNPDLIVLCFHFDEYTIPMDFTSQLLEIFYLAGDDFFEDEYRNFYWDWYNNPDPRILSLYPTDIEADLTEEVIYELTNQLLDMVTDIRDDYNLPVAPAIIPPEWVSGQAIQGGTLVLDNGVYFRTRYDMDAATNIIAPSDDTYNTRFLTFNQGDMRLSSSNVEMTRTYESTLADMTVGSIHLNRNTMYLVPDAEYSRLEVDRFSMFEVSTDSSRLIGQITHRNAWEHGLDTPIEGWAFRYDPQWTAGTVVDGQESRLRLTYSNS